MNSVSVCPAELDGTVEIGFVTENAAGSPEDADATPTYRVYENGSLVASGNAAALDAVNLDGHYRIAFTAATGTYTRGRNYLCAIAWVMNTVPAAAVAPFSVI